MRNTWLVGRHEFKTAISRRSFWLMTFLFPAIILALSFGNSLAGDLGDESLTEALQATSEPAVGYVDEAGFVGGLPPDVPPDVVIGFPTEADAQGALEAGRIDGYYVIPPDYLETGDLVLVQEDTRLLGAVSAGPLVEYVLDYALVGNAQVAAALVDPTGQVVVESAAAEGGTSPDGGSTSPDDGAGAAGETPEDEGTLSTSAVEELLPFVMLFILFFVITTSSSYLLQSVTKEKENRTAEVLLVTLEPRELMLGKVLGLGAVALVQIAIWVGGGLLVLWRYAGIPDLGSIGVSPTLFGWLLGFLLLGFIAYGSILAALGAMVPSQREGTQLMFVVLLPLILPIWFNYTLTSEPNGALSVALSLFPLSAPVAMIARLAAGDVPLWQPALALAGLAVTAYLFVLLGARVFRADTLLSGDAFSLGRLRAALLGDRS